MNFKNQDVQLILKIWMAYINAGSPYGETFKGLMEWMKDKVAE